MSEFENVAFGAGHDHIFLGAAHEQNERRTWTVIALCAAMMVAEIVGGTLFGSLALVADGLHMSTHAGAMLIAAFAYTYARRHANDARFVFGTGKLGDLAGFTSAIVLAMIALFIAYEAISRFLSPVQIHFDQAIPIAVLGLLVNLASVWLLSGDHHGHDHHHGHGHGHDAHHDHDDDDTQTISTRAGVFAISIFEDGVPPVFRISPAAKQASLGDSRATITTIRADGSRRTFDMAKRGDCLESIDPIPEPHAFTAIVKLHDSEHALAFTEHEHAHDHGHGGSNDATARDHNIRSAYIHVIADAAVSVLAIAGLVLARTFGWMWMDPLAGIVGALVIANWSYGLMRDTGRILLDVSPDTRLADNVRRSIESGGDRVTDLHVWRLGPGHMSAVVSVATGDPARDSRFYHQLLKRFKSLSHVTVEVHCRA
ncbi:CDF family Co(II)/Ni(II) efflux transporter DmeF [Burkholderia thailandensis]|uniref:Cation efflux system protein n=1 Tax=Burkholderia thailandensis (strain ATCC 700388 / DSM 13276 / CCUG 48851 / CIP 106301 / E264) TaxID=271848 RepID=Q2T8A9_BURTA|nr:CDF family Co(II)/Ni(II) efflux transporter DmeF [Burkholderia thailandensis]ABC34487.1 cation efflux system protein [Burkholderia thailandensis E264]AHI76073.1 cation diffusion facilitator transporter family protein [Burkholderia thailandensis 2002721723]AHI81583.1 cation diffusion facilitator transporter family protein [Burkholderia thailandensis E444]AIC89643.1 cation diffusion facilitator transporter family protein [Burkholderia thailandensis USAMRU Malaysia \